MGWVPWEVSWSTGRIAVIKQSDGLVDVEATKGILCYKLASVEAI